ncbi:MAG TPA: twin-arginine translocase TatA/TatE family subunit [Planctomycetaceae bacterium]|nr:twin-arginine translocase TatA/TatE family subunit [Planctomycetaceae bacterium]
MEMLIIGIIAVLLFGKRLPEVGRSLGKGLLEFKRGLRDIEDEVDTAGSYTSTTTTTPTTLPSSSTDTEDQEEATAPKFEPPSSEPHPEEEEMPL